MLLIIDIHLENWQWFYFSKIDKSNVKISYYYR